MSIRRTSFISIFVGIRRNDILLFKYQSRNSDVMSLSNSARGVGTDHYYRMIIWDMKWMCVVPLCMLSAVQFAMITRGSYSALFLLIFSAIIWSLLKDIFAVQSTWVPGSGCEMTQPWSPGIFTGMLVTISFDFIVLSLSIFKMIVLNRGRWSRLVDAIFHDGIIYFLLSFVRRSILLHFGGKPRHPTLSILLQGCGQHSSRRHSTITTKSIHGCHGFAASNCTSDGTTFTALFSTCILKSHHVSWQIAACRAVRRLANFSNDKPAI